MFIASWATAPDKSEPACALRVVRQERYLNDYSLNNADKSHTDDTDISCENMCVLCYPTHAVQSPANSMADC